MVRGAQPRSTGPGWRTRFFLKLLKAKREVPGAAGKRQVRAVRLQADSGHLQAGPRGAGEAASVQIFAATARTLREQPTSLESRVAPSQHAHRRTRRTLAPSWQDAKAPPVVAQHGVEVRAHPLHAQLQQLCSTSSLQGSWKLALLRASSLRSSVALWVLTLPYEPAPRSGFFHRGRISVLRGQHRSQSVFFTIHTPSRQSWRGRRIAHSILAWAQDCWRGRRIAPSILLWQQDCFNQCWQQDCPGALRAARAWNCSCPGL